MSITRLGNYSQLKGSTIKLPCIAATTANITLSGTMTIDGVAVVAGDRVLVKNQTTASDNGIWVVGSGSWSRAVDFSADDDAYEGLTVYITDGARYRDKYFILSTSGAITIGSTSLTFIPHGGVLYNTSTGIINYGTGFNYSGETILGKAVPSGFSYNIDSNGGQLNPGQLCYYFYDTNSAAWVFDVCMSDGPPRFWNTNMLAICLGDPNTNSPVTAGAQGLFLLKGFVSTDYLTLSVPDEGQPLYIQQTVAGAGYGKMCDSGGWLGAPGSDVWRCVGYLFSEHHHASNSTDVIRFDPSTDYIF